GAEGVRRRHGADDRRAPLLTARDQPDVRLPRARARPARVPDRVVDRAGARRQAGGRDRRPALGPPRTGAVARVVVRPEPGAARILGAAAAERVLLSPKGADVLRSADARVVPAAARRRRTARRAEDDGRRALHAPRLLVPLTRDLGAFTVALRFALDDLE